MGVARALTFTGFSKESACRPQEMPGGCGGGVSAASWEHYTNSDGLPSRPRVHCPQAETPAIQGAGVVLPSAPQGVPYHMILHNSMWVLTTLSLDSSGHAAQVSRLKSGDFISKIKKYVMRQPADQ